MASGELSTLPCSSLAGIGGKLSEKLAKKNIHTIQDVLFHLPYRYQDRTRITPIAHVQVNQHVVVEGVVQSCQILKGRGVQLLCTIGDASGSLSLRFFHFTKAQKDNLVKGVRLRCFGEVRWGKSHFEIIHPEYKVITPGYIQAVEENLRPIYPTTEGLSQHSLLKLSEQALNWMGKGYLLTDLLPTQLSEKYKLASLASAISYLHRPPPDAALALLEEGKHPAQTRLIFEELLAYQLSMHRLKQSVQQYQAHSLKSEGKLRQAFLNLLPFNLTGAQQKVCQEILADLQQGKPMTRLVQGDVGCGKTVVAAVSLLAAVETGFQGALMAPTEILAEQHYQHFCKWGQDLSLKVAWLSGKTKGKARTEILNNIAKHEVDIVIGTHALFQNDVIFAKLGLVVIDEQHRFGVEQRLALRAKGEKDNHIPHQLIMTATPIPRTLAMTCYADLDLSIIDELPPGRTPIVTVVLSNDRREEVIQRIQAVCGEKKQVYWVCTLIEDSETLTCQAAENTAELLSKLLPDVKVGLVHGRMKAAEKDEVMRQFKQAEIQLLVATTVIEVGVDVPNATLMVIENAERLGLSQLHQLRGRVGRGAEKSHCVLLYQAPLSQQAKARLAIMRETTDGFLIAQRDLELRGAGEILGTKQTGNVQFRIANIGRDYAMLPKIQKAADEIMQHYPECIDPIITRWLADNEQYVIV